jgi:multiple sugar transport system substrate-binding protein
MSNVAHILGRAAGIAVASLLLGGCAEKSGEVPVLSWYVFDEPSGAFDEAARRCGGASDGAYTIALKPLPSDADQQREQLVRRLAARDRDIDLIGMDVIWTAELAEAGWILPWPETQAVAARAGRLEAPLASVRYEGRVWAAPFTTNAQMLWYRSDRVAEPPATWEAMLEQAEALGEPGTIQAQGERYEGFTVFFASLLASAGGAVLGPDGETALLQREPTLRVLRLMRRFARSPAAPAGLANAREDQARLAFEAGDSSFMINYTFVWPSARQNAPEVARHMAWARWPAVIAGQPSRVTIGGINIGVGAYSQHPDLALHAAACIASRDNQLIAAQRGGLPPTDASLYDAAAVRDAFPFAAVLRATLRDAVQRPKTPLYNDVSLAISHTLHPMAEIEPERDLARLREAVGRALRSEGLL